VSKETSEQYAKDPFWVTGSIKWRLTGTIEQMTNSNSAAIAYVKNKFPTLALYLPNLYQFYIEPQ
jgi:zona occludens toxin (predicted ATPase)